MAARLAPCASSSTVCRSASVKVVCRANLRVISSPKVTGTAHLDDSTARPKSAIAAVEAPVSTKLSIPSKAPGGSINIKGVHHVALICADLEASLAFYNGVLGLEINPDRPHDKLPYRGAWLWIGPEMIHLMELPNPDPSDASTRPQHGGRDRHFCIGVDSLEPLIAKLEVSGVPYTRSASGRPAVFFRDPDANVIECVEGLAPWR